MTIKKGMFYTLLCFLALLLFTACSAVYRYIDEVEPEETYEENTDNLEYYEPREQMESYVLSEDGKKEWAIYWYLCGSDLESGYGSATADLEEMLCVELPENINVVIQTGGAKEWQNSFVNPNYLERFVYNSEGLKLVDTQPLESMGDPNTLSSFLDFAKKGKKNNFHLPPILAVLSAKIQPQSN